MARGQKSFHHLNRSLVNDDEIYMMVMLYTSQHKSLEHLARKFELSTSVAKILLFEVALVGHVVSA